MSDEVKKWREDVARRAKSEGLEDECLSFFDAAVERGESASIAAFFALYEWDIV